SLWFIYTTTTNRTNSIPCVRAAKWKRLPDPSLWEHLHQEMENRENGHLTELSLSSLRCDRPTSSHRRLIPPTNHHSRVVRIRALAFKELVIAQEELFSAASVIDPSYLLHLICCVRQGV